jgi:hypothetical protein
MLRYTTVADVGDLKYDDLASMHDCIRLEGLTFRALLSTHGVERLELARV